MRELVHKPRVDAYPTPKWSSVKKVHILGICGSAMGSLAGLLQSRGFEIRGSDQGAFPPMSDRLRDWGIPMSEGYHPEHLDWGPDAVIVGNVIRRDNPLAVAMRKRGLPHASFPEALRALFLEDTLRIPIAGTHGKTTTTALTMWLLEAAGRAPGYLIGGQPANFSGSFAFTAEAPFVIEADEYDTAYFDKRPKFAHYDPQVGVLTNIEFDHADIFVDLDHVIEVFGTFVDSVDPAGALVTNAHDPRALALARDCPARVITFGVDTEADWVARDLQASRGGMEFTLEQNGVVHGRVRSAMTGRHNAMNALAALAAVEAAGVSAIELAVGGALEGFKGVVKRQQVRGEVGGITVIDDYAHHPTAVKETLAALRLRYPSRRQWALFEAESNTSRRKIFEAQFADALASADWVVLSKPLKKNDKLAADEQFEPENIVAAVRAAGHQARHIPEFSDIATFVADNAEPGDVIVGMSGRDFGGVHALILEALRNRFSQR